MSAAALASIALVAQASWPLHVVGWALAALLGLGGYAFYRSREVRGSVTAGFRNPVALTRPANSQWAPPLGGPTGRCRQRLRTVFGFGGGQDA
jgi:hypothetical protein